MFSRGHHTAIFIISKFMLLLLKDLLSKLIITCTLKDKLTTWLCLIEGYLASLHDLVSFKIEHTICSRMRCITKDHTDANMATMLMSMHGAWIGEDGVQQGFPSQEGGPRLIRFESPRWRPKAIQV
jgi:hypothetical protein